jgi:dipeptide/tripeptide permease
MGLYGEFENLGGFLGPLIGGIAWSLAGIQAAFVTYAVAALLAAVVAAIGVASLKPKVSEASART